MLDVAGAAPFDSIWNYIWFAATLQPAQFNPNATTEQIVARTSIFGLQWWGIKESGCSGASPCWQDLTILARTPFFTDNQGYQHAEYYRTLQVADIDGDGYVEALGRDPEAGITTHLLSTRADRWSNTFSGPTLTSGPSSDPLWSDPSYYETIQTGDVDGDGDDELVARGKYGIRTWAWDSTKGWERPLPYGFGSFARSPQSAAFALLNGYLAIAGGNTIRDSYTSINTEVMTNYEDCLTESIASGATMPPTSTCDLLGPEQQIPNHRDVSAEAWKSMVETIEQEIAMARAVDGHFNQSMSSILNDLYVLNQADFDYIVNTLFPGGGPGGGTDILAIFQDLFFGFARALASLVPFGVGGTALLNTMSGIISAVGEIQTGGATNTTVSYLQTQIAETAGHAITQSNAFFEYVAQDAGLLYLYGTLINDQVWEIQQQQHDTAIATGEFTTAKWIYKTLLPHQWGIWVCGPGRITQLCEELAVQPQFGVNAIHIPSDPDFVAFLTRYTYEPYPVSVDGALYMKLFYPIQEDCPLTASSAGAWNYAGCNVGFGFADVLNYEDGWNLPCMVATQIPENSYQCQGGDQLPPHWYPPGR